MQIERSFWRGLGGERLAEMNPRSKQMTRVPKSGAVWVTFDLVSVCSSPHSPRPRLEDDRTTSVPEEQAMPAPERRSEPRVSVDLRVQVCGIDADGKRFEQAATARNISLRGALLVGLDRTLRSGDLIKIQLGERSARFQVVWVSPDTLARTLKVAVQRIEADSCIWADKVVQEAELPTGHD